MSGERVYRQLHDSRILKTCLQMEEGLRLMARDLRDHLVHVPVRARLAPLFEDSSALRALRASASQASAACIDVQEDEDVLASLLDACVALRDFYLRELDRLTSAEHTILFGRLAAEAAERIRVVREAMAVLARLPHPAGVPLGR
jgi:hypothetical protein